jgi:hypothetical protein
MLPCGSSGAISYHQSKVFSSSTFIKDENGMLPRKYEEVEASLQVMLLPLYAELCAYAPEVERIGA